MNQANSKQKKWLSDMAAFISQESLGILYPEYEGQYNFELHHVLGRSAKHNKVAIGHWFVIPVPKELHNVMSNHPDNVTHFKKRFVTRFGSQCWIFQCLVGVMGQWGYDVPNGEVYEAIMDTRA